MTDPIRAALEQLVAAGELAQDSISSLDWWWEMDAAMKAARAALAEQQGDEALVPEHQGVEGDVAAALIRAVSSYTGWDGSIEDADRIRRCHSWLIGCTIKVRKLLQQQQAEIERLRAQQMPQGEVE